MSYFMIPLAEEKKRKVTMAIRFALLVSLSLGATTCFATTSYSLYNIGTEHLGDIGGLASNGTLTLTAFICSNPAAVACYNVFDAATNTITSTETAPTTFDNGIPCAPPPNPFGGAIQAVCNGDIQFVYAIHPAMYGLVPYVDIAGSIVPVPTTGAPVGVVLNSEGYIAWDDGSLDEFFEAVPNVSVSQTPEPSTLLLLTTGLLALLGAAKWKKMCPALLQTFN